MLAIRGTIKSALPATMEKTAASPPKTPTRFFNGAGSELIAFKIPVSPSTKTRKTLATAPPDWIKVASRALLKSFIEPDKLSSFFIAVTSANPCASTFSIQSSIPLAPSSSKMLKLLTA